MNSAPPISFTIVGRAVPTLVSSRALRKTEMPVATEWRRQDELASRTLARTFVLVDATRTKYEPELERLLGALKGPFDGMGRVHFGDRRRGGHVGLTNELESWKSEWRTGDDSRPTVSNQAPLYVDGR